MIFQTLTEILRQSRRYRRIMLEPLGLTPFHSSYLTEIDSQPGLSQDQLAQLLCLDKSNVARRVAAMEEEGFISRTPGARDKRVMELRLTQRAQEVLPPVREILNQWDDYLTEGMTEEERALLDALLTRLKDRAAAWRKEDCHV